MGSLEQKVQRLLDIEEVKNLIATYARGADRQNDPEIMAPLFSEDAVWECEGFGRYQGRAAIAAGLAETGQRDITWTLHYMISPTVQINDDATTGNGHYYLWELANMRGESGNIEACWAGGTYDVELIKRDDRWFFHFMRLNLKLIAPYDKGWKDGPIQSF
ncbi:MAG: nuclear transport factor 2 family protein [Immundisolibacteraceae bacterium]|nr:nuclear transport factor 2 family protein [Immundisolibacteraceae bacterium]